MELGTTDSFKSYWLEAVRAGNLLEAVRTGNFLETDNLLETVRIGNLLELETVRIAGPNS